MPHYFGDTAAKNQKHSSLPFVPVHENNSVSALEIGLTDFT